MVDILLATYNGEKYLAEQIDSVLDQTYQDFRILIRDDNSNDRTVEIIKDYQKKYPDKILFITDDMKCGNSVSNFMQLTEYACSEYAMYCDQDDFWFPDKIKTTLEIMQNAERKKGKDNPFLVFADYKIVDSSLNEAAHRVSNSQIASCSLKFSRLLVQNYVTGCLMMVNKALYSILGEYHNDILMHDWWAALIASAMGDILYIPETVMLYRQHINNAVGAVNIKSINYRLHKLFDRNTRNAKYLCEKQAELFLSRYAERLDANILETLHNFLAISGQPSKLKRIDMLKKGDFLKSDRIRRLGQFWYI